MQMFYLPILFLSSVTSIFIIATVRTRGVVNANPWATLIPFVWFLVSFTALLDRLSYLSFDKSFISFVNSNGVWHEFAMVAVVSMVIGMAFDFVGIYLADLWEYPSVLKNKLWYLAYSFIWITLGFCMQLVWLFVGSLNLSFIVTSILVALVCAFVIEVLNKYGYFWVYKGLLKKPLILYLGWYIFILIIVVWTTLHISDILRLGI